MRTRILDGQSSRGHNALARSTVEDARQPVPAGRQRRPVLQGSIVLGTGFILEPEEAQALIAKDPRNKAVLFPYLNGEDLNSRWDCSASRWVINFHDWPIERAMEYHDVFCDHRREGATGRQRTNSDWN